MKRFLHCALFCPLLSGAAFAQTIKIGVFEPASGDNGAGGNRKPWSIEYANYVVPTVEVGGETFDIELVIVDNQSQTDKAVSAAQSLVDAGVSIVLGSYGSGVSMAGGEIFQSAKIPAIGCSCTNPGVTSLCDYYWRVCFLDPFGDVMANFAMDERPPPRLACRPSWAMTIPPAWASTSEGFCCSVGSGLAVEAPATSRLT